MARSSRPVANDSFALQVDSGSESETETEAEDVWITHGREDAIIHHAQTLGLRARALSLIGYGEDEA